MCTVRTLYSPVHVIPKPTKEQGLIVGWPTTSPPKEELDEVGDHALILGVQKDDGEVVAC